MYHGQCPLDILGTLSTFTNLGNKQRSQYIQVAYCGAATLKGGKESTLHSQGESVQSKKFIQESSIDDLYS